MSLLIDKQLESILPKLYEQDGKEEQIAYVRFFSPFSDWEWYVLEYSPMQKLCFGLVSGFEKEYGYFSLDELESVEYSYGFKIQRDYDFVPTNVKEICNGRYTRYQ